MSVNLAELPQEERELMQADLIATQIRQGTSGMGLKARREHARSKLDRMPAEQRERVLAALTARAGK